MNRKWTFGLIIASVSIMVLLAAMALSAGQPVPAGPTGHGGSMQNNPAVGPQGDTSRQPPAEAIDACSGKSAGAACQFTDREGTASGTCDDKPGVMACAPARTGGTGPAPVERQPSQALPAVSGTKTQGPATTIVAIPVATTGAFSLSSDAGADGGTLPVEYTCNGAGATPALSWSGAPAGTVEYALMVTTIPVDGSTRWNWVLYGIPSSATGLEKNSQGVGTTGTGSHGTVRQYDPPCPQGPGAKTYTFTLYALSASPYLPGSADQVTGEVLASAISSITLDKASFDLSYGSS